MTPRLLRHRPFAALLLALAASACRGTGESAHERETRENQRRVDSLARAGGVIDSILPMPVMLARFREGAGPRPDTLRSADRSREAVARRWVAAMRGQDTTALNAMVVDRGEFAWLVFEALPLSRPPYSAPPELAWSQVLATSNDGAQTALRKLGGRAVTLVGPVACAAVDSAPTGVRLHGGCTVTLTIDGARQPAAAWFGTIVEHEGRFKLLGLANKQ